MLQSRGGGYYSNLLPSVNFPIYHHCQNTGYLLNIMFIFDRCCRSSAALTPVKYECDTNNLTGTSARSKILLTEKLTNGALVTPTHVLLAVIPSDVVVWVESYMPILMSHISWLPIPSLCVYVLLMGLAKLIDVTSETLAGDAAAGNNCLCFLACNGLILVNCMHDICWWPSGASRQYMVLT